MKEKVIKISIVLIVIVCIVVGIAITVKINRDKKFKEENAIKFSSEYTQVPEDNVYVYTTPDEIIDIMENGTGIVFIGYPECPWCQNYVKYLNEVAKEMNIEKIFYCNKKKMKENDEEKYKKIVYLLEEHLPYSLYSENPTLYVPNVTFILDGKIIGNNNATAIIDAETPEEYWTDEKISDLKQVLKKHIQEIL